MEPAANPIFRLQLCYFHFLLNKVKYLIQVGPFILSRIASDPDSTFLSVNQFRHCAPSQTLVVKIDYGRTVSYIVRYEGGGFYSFTFGSGNQTQISDLDGFFRVMCRLCSYEEAMEVESWRMKVEEHWPTLSPETPIYQGDPVKDTINSSGLFIQKGFVKVGEVIKGGVQKATNYIQSKIENKSSLNITKARTVFGTIKSGVSKAFGVTSRVVSAVVDPVLSRVHRVNAGLCRRIDNSDNRTLKYLKDMASTSNNAIQNAFYGLKSAVGNIGSSLSSGTGAIIEKKFTTEENEEQQQYEQYEPGSSAVMGPLENTNIPLDKEKSSLDIIPDNKAHEDFGQEALAQIDETPLDNVDTINSLPDEPQPQPQPQPQSTQAPRPTDSQRQKIISSPQIQDLDDPQKSPSKSPLPN